VLTYAPLMHVAVQQHSVVVVVVVPRSLLVHVAGACMCRWAGVLCFTQSPSVAAVLWAVPSWVVDTFCIACCHAGMVVTRAAVCLQRIYAMAMAITSVVPADPMP
jgi:hypothetical protein